MNAAQLKGIRLMAETKQTEKYTLKDGNGYVVMFNLTKQRAEEYSRYYKGSQVIRQK